LSKESHESKTSTSKKKLKNAQEHSSKTQERSRTFIKNSRTLKNVHLKLKNIQENPTFKGISAVDGGGSARNRPRTSTSKKKEGGESNF